ncbi:MAG: hypothetical protein ACP5G0_07040 [Desulfomonilia bacterium]
MDNSEDKMLGDDDIIDLTDLLEEGKAPEEPVKEQQHFPRKVTEPDSFDLGKEISMDYDVSVDELEQDAEKIDVDVKLSSNEEAALSPETREAQEMPQEEPSPEEEKVDLSVLEGRETAAQAEQEPSGEEPMEHAAAADHEKMEIIRETAKELLPHGEGSEEEPSEISVAPEQVEAAKRDLVFDQALEELKTQMPEILRQTINPLIAELVKEIMATTREQLPDIVEKVIREEIAKLKKLDS